MRRDNRVDNRGAQPVFGTTPETPAHFSGALGATPAHFAGVVVVDEVRAPVVLLELLHVRQVDRLPENQQAESDDTAQWVPHRSPGHLRRDRLLPIW